MATLPLVPSTELDGVNVLLISIGESPVNTVETLEGPSEVSIARTILHQTSRQVQSLGLQCNSEESFPLVKDVNDEIKLPTNTLKIDASDTSLDIVARGNRLYDRTNHTYKFDTNNEDSLKVDIVLFLPFEELPQAARDYITLRAARVFQSKVLGSETLYQFTMQDEMEARMLLVQAEADSGDYNMLRKNSDLQTMLTRS